jgi:hypothetical protein
VSGLPLEVADDLAVKDGIFELEPGQSRRFGHRDLSSLLFATRQQPQTFFFRKAA